MINANYLVPEPVEGYTAKLSPHRLFAREEGGVKRGGLFFIPFDKLRDQVKSMRI